MQIIAVKFPLQYIESEFHALQTELIVLLNGILKKIIRYYPLKSLKYINFPTHEEITDNETKKP